MAGTVTINVIWGGPIVGITVVEGLGDDVVDSVDVGFEDGAKVGVDGKLPQPSNTTIRGSAKASIWEKSFKDFICPAKRYISTESTKDPIFLLWTEYKPKFNAF